MTRQSSTTATTRKAWRLCTRLTLPGLVLASTQVLAGPVQGTLRVVSDYVERSYSRSDQHPALQGQLSTLLDQHWFVGLSASSVRLGGAELELAPYLGVDLPLGEDWRGVASLVGYVYEQDVLGQAGHYVEPMASLHYRDLLSFNGGIAVHAYGYAASTPWVEAEARYPLTDVTRVSAKLGYEGSCSLAGADYAYWNAGLTHYWSAHLASDIRYYGSRASGGDDPAAPGHRLLEPLETKDRLVFSLSVGF